MGKTWINIVFLFVLQCSFGQSQKYWVYTQLNEHQAERLLYEVNGQPIIYSGWLGAHSVVLNPSQRLHLQDHPMVDSITPVNRNLVVLSNPMLSETTAMAEELGFGLTQIKAEKIVEAGLTGAGVKVGIIDGGFLEADQSERLQHFFRDNNIVATRDFITPDLGPYEGSKFYDDGHGKDVWEVIGGYDRETRILHGLATASTYYLARTDHGRKEYRGEEDFLIAALEWMDSLGVRLVNISLGYSKGFDDPAEDYLPEQMDGQTVALTRAAQIASREKGMLLVVAGGNDGTEEVWNVVSTPGDAKDVLTVGASMLKRPEKSKFSSIGGEFLSYLKPDVVCFSTLGTSFAAPVLTGLAACMWEFDPGLSNLEIKSIIEQSSLTHPYGNNYIGYGYPNCNRVLTLLNKTSPDWEMPREIVLKKKSRWVLKDLPQGDRVTIFHKKDWKNVGEQYSIKIVRGKLKIKRPDDIARTTLIFRETVIELIWPE